MIKKKAIAIFLILCTLLVLGHFKINQLFDAKQIFLVLFGTAIMYLTGNGFKKITLHKEEVARCAMLTGYLEAFTLIILNLQSAVPETVITVISQNIRPILYSFIIWLLLEGFPNQNRKDAETETTPTGTVGAYYTFFHEKGLTNRETEVAILAVKGMTNAEIAYELSIAETTVKKHMSHIFEKLCIRTRDELKKGMR